MVKYLIYWHENLHSPRHQIRVNAAIAYTGKATAISAQALRRLKLPEFLDSRLSALRTGRFYT
jgi:hypothetical protein